MTVVMAPGPVITGIAKGMTIGSCVNFGSETPVDLGKIIPREIMNSKIPPAIPMMGREIPNTSRILSPKKVKRSKTVKF